MHPARSVIIHIKTFAAAALLLILNCTALQANPPDKEQTPLYLPDFSISSSRTYDGTTNIQVISTGTLNTQSDGTGETPENVSLAGTASATVETPDAGSNKSVTITGLSLEGDASDDYQLELPDDLTATISRRTVNHDGLMTIHNKTYDTTTEAEINNWGAIQQGDIINGDVVSLRQDPEVTTAAFEDAEIGDNKAVYVHNLALEGEDAHNYSLNTPPLPPGHGGGDDWSPPELLLYADILPAPFRTIIIEGPATLTAGEQSQPYTLRTQDSYGNDVAMEETITINLSTSSGSPAEAHALNPPAPEVAGGTSSASFTYTEELAGTYSLTATTDAPAEKAQTVSGSFTVTIDHAPATTLQFQQQPPASSMAGEPFSPAVEMRIEDAFGNTATTATNTISLSLQSMPSKKDLPETSPQSRSKPEGHPDGSETTSREPAKLLGTVSLDAIDGVAAFDDLHVEKTGQQYKIDAISSGLTSSQSGSFNIVSAETTELVFSSVPGSYVAGNAPVRYTVLRRDAYGNHADQDKVTVYLHHDSGESLAGFYQDEGMGTAISSLDLEVDETTHTFWYQDKQAGERTITASDQDNLEAGGSDIQDAEHTLTISPKPLTIRVEDMERVYGNEDGEHAFRDFAGLLMEGDGPADITGGNGEASDVTFTTNTDASSPVGSYPSDIGILSTTLDGERADSYAISINKGMTTITKKTVHIGGTLQADNKTYDALPDATLTTGDLTIPGKEGDDDLTLDNLEAAFSEPAVGTRTVSITQASLAGDDAGNYELSMDGAPEGSATISPATLTVTVDDQFKVVDGEIFPEGEYTVSYSGFVAEEGEEVITGDPAYAGEALTATDVGTYVITASGPDIQTVNYDLLWEDGLLHITEKSLAFDTQPADAVAGEILPAITLHIIGEDGEVLTDADDQVTLSLQDNPGGATLSGTLTKAATEGVVEFDDLSIRTTGEGYTLRARAEHVTSATSDPFGITGAAASHWVLTEAPDAATAGTESLTFTLQVHDVYDNPTDNHQGFNNLVSITDDAGTLNPGSIDVASDQSESAFTWNPPVEAGTYTLTVDAGQDFDMITHPVHIHHAPAGEWVFETAPAGTAVAGEEMEPHPVIYVQDAYGNLATSYSGPQVVVSLQEGASASLQGDLVTPVEDGVATFGPMWYEVAETITLVFTLGDDAISTTQAENRVEVHANKPATLSLEQHPIYPNDVFDAGDKLEPAPTVKATDAFGNRVPAEEIRAVLNKPQFAEEADSIIDTNADGVATFDNLIISVAGSDFEVHFAAEGTHGEVLTGHFTVHIRPSTPATAAIISGPTATEPEEWSDDYTLILLDDYGNESHSMGNMVFDMNSTSNDADFRPGGRGEDIMIPSGLASTTFQYYDSDIGQQTLTASWSYEDVRSQEFPDGERFWPEFTDAEYLVEVTDAWVWMAREDYGHSNAWSDLANWNQKSGEPGPEHTVLVRNYHADIPPRIDGAVHAEVEKMEIESDLTLRVAPQASLTAGHFILKPGCDKPVLHLEADGTGTGSVIHHNEDVYARVERHLPGEGQNWHMLSSPVRHQIIDGEGASDFTGNGFFLWYEPMQAWVEFYDNRDHLVSWEEVHDAGGVTNTFRPARGYMATYEPEGKNKPERLFEGALGVKSQVFTLNRYAGANDPYRGFNLAGNPYPSAIDWQADEGWEGRENLVGDEELGGFNMWIWNPEAGNYGVFNSNLDMNDLPDGWDLNGVSNIIPPMQGFWVRATEGSHLDELVVKPEARVHAHADSPQKSRKPDFKGLHIAVSMHGTGYGDAVMLLFDDHQEGGAEKMFSMKEEAPGLYVQHADTKYTIRNYPDMAHDMEVPVYFSAGTEDTYTLEIQGGERFAKLILKDRLKGQEVLLSGEDVYTFYGHPSDMTDRFRLVLSDEESTDTPADFGQPALHSWTAGQLLHIYSGYETTRLQIHDLYGRVAMADELKESGRHTVDPGLPAGLYIVTLEGQGRSRSFRLVFTK